MRLLLERYFAAKTACFRPEKFADRFSNCRDINFRTGNKGERFDGVPVLLHHEAC